MIANCKDINSIVGRKFDHFTLPDAFDEFLHPLSRLSLDPCNSHQVAKAVFLSCCPGCPSCPAHLNSTGWATCAIWAPIKN